MAKCRECGDEVTWVMTPFGGRMPVDSVPDDEGELVLVDEGNSWLVCYRFQPDNEEHLGMERFENHLNRCTLLD